MNSTRTVVLAALLLLLLPNLICAESWRGIVPLRSTKTDVEKLLGEPSKATNRTLAYHLPDETIFFSLITDDRRQGDRQLLQPGTVEIIEVIPKNPLYVTDLGLDEKKIIFMKGSKPEYAGFFGYVDVDAGLIVLTNGSKVGRIFYFANTKDRLRCPSCSIDPQTLADMPICGLCPTIAVACRDKAEAGIAIIFTANVVVGDPASTLTYHWTVSAGTIQRGQGTSSIEVDTTNLAGKTITATVEVGELIQRVQRLRRATPQLFRATTNYDC